MSFLQVDSESTNIVVLNRDNYRDVIFDNTKDVFVKFYASWCPHCIHMQPDWEDLATEINNRPATGVIIAEMEDAQIPNEFNI